MASLLDLIDLKDTKSCKVKIRGKEAELVHLRIENKKYFAILAGGYSVEIDKLTFDDLGIKLGEHLKKHILNK
jgi:hypothetical protein